MASNSPKPNGSNGAIPIRHIVSYAVLSLGCLLIGLLCMFVILSESEWLVRFGLVGRFFYVALLPLGLAAGGFLFGAMRSYASYDGKALGGKLQLRGPAVVAAMVVIGGFWLPQPDESFPVVVFVHSETGQQDSLGPEAGPAVLTLGLDRRTSALNEKGQATFLGVPSRFRGQELIVSADNAKYRTGNPTFSYSAEGTTINLPVSRKPIFFEGVVRNSKGLPLEEARVSGGGLETVTDDGGNFILEIPGDRIDRNWRLEFDVEGYASISLLVVPGGGQISIRMKAITQ